MHPVILQINENSPVIVAVFANQGQRRQFLFKEGGEQGTYYVAFQYANATWQRVPLKDANVFSEANLLLSAEGIGSWVSLAEKQKANNSRRVSDSWRTVPLN
ncbi:MAG: hypothetical protein WCE38_18860 [Burkholderiales bacterium]